jgi:hypothetical protein
VLVKAEGIVHVAVTAGALYYELHPYGSSDSLWLAATDGTGAKKIAGRSCYELKGGATEVVCTRGHEVDVYAADGTMIVVSSPDGFGYHSRSSDLDHGAWELAPMGRDWVVGSLNYDGSSPYFLHRTSADAFEVYAIPGFDRYHTNVDKLAASGTELFVAVSGFDDGAAPTSLYVESLGATSANPAPGAALGASRDFIDALAVSDTHVFYSIGQKKGLLVQKKDGSGRTTILPDDGGVGPAYFDGSHVYFATDTGAYRINGDGSALTKLVPAVGHGFPSLTVDDTFLYYSDGEQITRVGK